jgi:hypothetical protein
MNEFKPFEGKNVGATQKGQLRRRRAAEQRDEIAASDLDCHETHCRRF